MLTLYEVLGSNSPESRHALFCPTAVKTRFALINKGIEFQTKFVTYHDLRFIWKQKLGVEKATTPFIEDGSTFVMDSEAIFSYLDKTYPDKPSPFLPDGTLPIDIESTEYKAALESYAEFAKTIGPLRGHVFTLFAPLLVQQFDKEGPENDYDYWTSDARLGAGTWDKLTSASVEETLIAAKKAVQPLNAIILQSPANQKFFSSKTIPGAKDSLLYGAVRLLRGTSASNTQAVFGEGPIGQWLKNIEEYYAKELVEINARDPK